MSHVYTLTEKGKKIDAKELSGQQAVIFFALLRKGNLTAADIADAVGKKLKTRQEPLRVCMFYLVRWKKAGLLRWAKGKAKAKPKAKGKADVKQTEERLRHAKIVAVEPLKKGDAR
jgi:hypothetical protein